MLYKVTYHGLCDILGPPTLLLFIIYNLICHLCDPPRTPPARLMAWAEGQVLICFLDWRT